MSVSGKRVKNTSSVQTIYIPDRIVHVAEETGCIGVGWRNPTRNIKYMDKRVG